MTLTPQPAPAEPWIEVFRFGAFSLSLRSRQLLLRGAPVKLGARAFDLLAALVDSRGRLATKDDLMQRVWAGTVVDENNLAAQISALRKILAADPGLSACLQTVPGRGYRFLADVRLEAAPPAEGRNPAAAGEETLSLVVLPFRALSSDPDQAFFAQGLSHTVTTDLSRISGLLVISSSTAAAFDGGDLDPREVSRLLAARFVLTGSIQRSGERARINAQLVDGQTGQHLWSERLDGEASGLFDLQDRITGRIANAISREIFVAAARTQDARNLDPRSFELVMQGIAADNRPQSLQTLQQQEALFARALEREPDHAEALSRLARAILLQVTQAHSSRPVDDAVLARGVEAAERALALDPDNARAHCAMGLVHVLRGDFERAVVANETAIALDRNFALAHNNLGNSLVHLGHGAAALTAAEQALRLDPRGPQVAAFWTTSGFARLLLGEFGQAVAAFARGQAANPRLPRAQVGSAIALALQGETAAARRAAHALVQWVPHYRLSQTMDACTPRSSPAYREFYEGVLYRGAQLADLPI